MMSNASSAVYMKESIEKTADLFDIFYSLLK